MKERRETKWHEERERRRREDWTRRRWRKDGSNKGGGEEEVPDFIIDRWRRQGSPSHFSLPMSCSRAFCLFFLCQLSKVSQNFLFFVSFQQIAQVNRLTACTWVARIDRLRSSLSSRLDFAWVRLTNCDSRCLKHLGAILTTLAKGMFGYSPGIQLKILFTQVSTYETNSTE